MWWTPDADFWCWYVCANSWYVGMFVQIPCVGIFVVFPAVLVFCSDFCFGGIFVLIPVVVVFLF